jgi:hypothetical protein
LHDALDALHELVFGWSDPAHRGQPPDRRRLLHNISLEDQ